MCAKWRDQIAPEAIIEALRPYEKPRPTGGRSFEGGMGGIIDLGMGAIESFIEFHDDVRPLANDTLWRTERCSMLRHSHPSRYLQKHREPNAHFYRAVCSLSLSTPRCRCSSLRYFVDET